MTEFEFEILSMLKERYKYPVGENSYQVAETGKDVSKRQFYLKELNDNLIEPMSKEVEKQYLSASGNELDDKMKALRSSSAMTYNIFANTDIEIIGDKHINAGIYTVEYEKGLHTLDNNRPAHLDVLLDCLESGEAIACEMKLAEWIFSKPGKLREAYLDEKNYIDENKNAKVFIQVAQELSYNKELDRDRKLAPKFNRYDGFQMFKHALACYNACSKGELKVNRLTIVNCVWEIPEKQRLSPLTLKRYDELLRRHHDEYQEFRQIMNPIILLFEQIEVEVDIIYYNLCDFISLLKLPSKSINYLQRYI